MEGTIGEIKMFGGNFAPRTWALCDGQLLSINSNQALFSIIGTIYGGDGRTTFALPDLRGRTAVHAGNGPGLSDRRLGSRGGSQTNTLSVTQMPSHNHIAIGTVKATAAVGNQRIPTGQSFAGSASDSQYIDAAPNVNMAANNVEVTLGNTGGNQSVNNMQPYGVVNYIICMQGLFPSRN